MEKSRRVSNQGQIVSHEWDVWTFEHDSGHYIPGTESIVRDDAFPFTMSIENNVSSIKQLILAIALAHKDDAASLALGLIATTGRYDPKFAKTKPSNHSVTL